MDSNLDAKRRELFELHKLKLGTDAPLMRKPVTVGVMEKEGTRREPLAKSQKIKYAVFGVAGLVVVLELFFLIRESGWLK